MPYKGFKHGLLQRRAAASTLQRAWRRRRFRTNNRYKKNRFFNRRVNNAVLKKEPVQYSIFAKDQVSISQIPIVYANISNINYDRDNTNPTFYRSSAKCKPLNLHMNFRIEAQDSPYNQVTVMMVRHKRSDPIVDADLTPSPPGTGALTNAYDKPFLPSTLTPNSTCADMSGISTTAKPHMLAQLMNPKVVDVMWTKSFFVQPQWRATGGGAAATTFLAGQTYPEIKEFEVNHKFTKDIWKYQHQAAGGTSADFPYNNKSYHILAWSDSVIGTAHPLLSCQFRMSFKDLD